MYNNLLKLSKKKKITFLKGQKYEYKFQQRGYTYINICSIYYIFQDACGISHYRNANEKHKEMPPHAKWHIIQMVYLDKDVETLEPSQEHHCIATSEHSSVSARRHGTTSIILAHGSLCRRIWSWSLGYCCMIFSMIRIHVSSPTDRAPITDQTIPPKTSLVYQRA